MVHVVRKKRRLPKDAFIYIPLLVLVLLGVAVVIINKLPTLFFRQFGSQPTNSISITDYGAKPNDTTDDTAAIVNAISAAKAQGKTVYVPSGTFNHTHFYDDSVQIVGDGTTSILNAPDPNNASIIIHGNGAVLSNLYIKTTPTTRTSSGGNAIYAEQTTNYTIRNVTVDGANGAGILSWESSYGHISDNTVENSLADGIHTTGGSHDIYVGRNIVRNTGDDMIAVVSYNNGQCNTAGGTDLVYNVLIDNNDVANQSWGRGITVVGGRDVTIQYNKVSNSYAAGMYFTAESAYNTCSDNNLKVINNTLTNVASSSSTHPAILVWADATGQSVQNVLLQNNSIAPTATKNGIMVEPASNNIAVVGNTITAGAGGVVDTSSGNVYCTGNTYLGTPTPATSCGGAYNFTVTGATVTPDPTSTPTPLVIASPMVTATPIPPTLTPTKGTTDTTPPTVVITNPANGAKVTTIRYVNFAATATDNVGVAKVLFYIDGRLVANDYATPYAYVWNTRRASSGTHTLKAVAYDAAGNNSYSQITVYK